MNPNARSFNFNPNAQGFVPPGVQQQQQQQQQQGGNPYAQGGYYQQGFNQQQGFNKPYPGQQYSQQGAYGNHHQQGFNQGGYAQQGFTGQPVGGYQPRGGQYPQQPRQNNYNANPQQHQIPAKPQGAGLPPNPTAAAAESQAARKPVSLSIGGGAPKPAAAEAKADADAPRKPVSISIGGAKPAADKKPVSISIGGGAAKKPEAAALAAPAAVEAPKPKSAAPEASETSAPAAASADAGEAPAPAGGVAAVKAAAAASTPAASSTAASSRAQSPAPAPATKAASKLAAAAVSEKSKTDADKVLEDVNKATDEETLKDLFGDKSDSLKSHLNIVFIGHVDAGKSTMGGNLLYLTGMVDKRTMEKYEREAKEAGRESWYLSWALDSTAQEREKGKTVEVGRAYFETGKRRYTILDAPGHKSFVPSMISGAAQADVAVLVISARKGEFETGFERGGQTREHAVLVKTAGVQRLVVVINKMDEPTVLWEQARYDEIVGKLSPFLRGTGFNPKTDVTFIPVSAYSGQNLKERVPKDVCSWYQGPSLLEFLDDLSLSDRKINAPLKMPISEKYNDMGTVVVGKLEAGKVKKGDSLVLMPNRTPVEVVSIFNEQEEEVPAAISGDNVRVKLKGVDHEDVTVGFVLSDAKEPVHVATRFEAQLAILEHRNIICAGYSAVLHCHTLSEEVSLSALLHYYDKKTGKKSKRGPQFAKKGMKVIALIEAAAPVSIERFKDYPQLGRFTLRDEGRTIAIGKVTKLITSDEELLDVSKLSVEAMAGAN
ncbi:translation termination factor GTPase eRF3 [Thecaphora frezii]